MRVTQTALLPALLTGLLLGATACSTTSISRENLACDEQGRCIEGYVCNTLTNVCEIEVENCIDADGDGYGVGQGCAGLAAVYRDD